MSVRTIFLKDKDFQINFNFSELIKEPLQESWITSNGIAANTQIYNIGYIRTLLFLRRDA